MGEKEQNEKCKEKQKKLKGNTHIYLVKKNVLLQILKQLNIHKQKYKNGLS